MTGPIIGVDTGGTFTDIVLFDPRSGRLHLAKTPSTPHDASEGFGNGISEVLEVAALGGPDIDRVLHATTVATNLILEQKGPPTALIVNRGFRFLLEIGRHSIPRRANLFAWCKPQRPIAPDQIFEIGGRIDPDGSEVEALDEAALRAAAEAIAEVGIGTVAVVFLHSYANPAHERRAREIIAEVTPAALTSISAEVLPVMREYERGLATALNAYVKPVVSRYVGRLEERVDDRKIAAPLLLMKSNGGVAGTDTVRAKPVETALSGPAAGIVGANIVAAAAGIGDIITVDIGGTSADIALIRGGALGLTTRSVIGNWPIPLPMVDLTTIGAGGGSIAKVDKGGVLTVGPDSAGANPGPVCYRRGGTEPTVTDAHLVLGHLPEALLDGDYRLDRALAEDAIRTRIAEPLGLSVDAAARGILEIIDNTMVGAIRVVSVERGHDPADFTLLPFGGAGPLHGGPLARLAGCRRVLVPPAPGVLSAFGLLASDLRAEFSRSCLQRDDAFDFEDVAGVFAALSAQAEAWLESEGVPAQSRRMTRQVSLRYEGQGSELTVPWPGDVDAAALAEVVAAFHTAHEALYSFRLDEVRIEAMTLRVDAVGKLPPLTLPEIPSHTDVASARVGDQPVSFAEGVVSAPIYDRARLGAGSVLEGPAIITQLDSTTLLLPGQRATVHPTGSLLIEEE
ncbi:hydantoinase/oxoprolinase family protein [Acuticoccus mangrovi]|uniref:Hydantoinase/oxoprolinase family protein n=1 Tax=Acuticoccus mangrovi TaxID=2796142 RepID=A0A934MF09_9HYPH|nr:hydantoinase/oxoprolinase family protein [Acuticoccus mangrovi]MBJ3778152.1 hydantoinase/oxoprolinase family protein [Acuticoccus mangrovi]